MQGDAFLRRGYRVQEFVEAVESMLGEFDRHLESVDDPTEDDLASGPVSVALGEFFSGRWFFA